MSETDLEDALRQAANAFRANRRAAGRLSKCDLEMVFVAARYGLSPGLLVIGEREVRDRRTRTRRDETRLDALGTAFRNLDPDVIQTLEERLQDELRAQKRAARRRDPRYDLDRHAAIARLLKLLGSIGESPERTRPGRSTPTKRARCFRGPPRTMSDPKPPSHRRVADPGLPQ